MLRLLRGRTSQRMTVGKEDMGNSGRAVELAMGEGRGTPLKNRNGPMEKKRRSLARATTTNARRLKERALRWRGTAVRGTQSKSCDWYHDSPRVSRETETRIAAPEKQVTEEEARILLGEEALTRQAGGRPTGGVTVNKQREDSRWL